jgi:hypothetical protein
MSLLFRQQVGFLREYIIIWGTQTYDEMRKINLNVPFTNLKRVPESILQHEACREKLKVLERYNITVMNDNTFDLFGIYDENATERLLSHPIVVKMIDELIEKDMFPGREIDVAKMILEAPQHISAPPSQLAVELIENQLHLTGIYGIEYSTKIDMNRLELLIGMRGGTSYLDVIKMIMRYEMLSPNGQQYAIPLTTYKHLHKKMGIDFEGFASPINSQLLEVVGKDSYCSLFESDKIFGSLGNFFEKDNGVYKIVGKRSIINPPFVESILLKMSEVVEETIGSDMIVVVPTWRDSEYYIKLTKLAKTHGKSIMLDKRRHKYHFEDMFEYSKKDINGGFNVTWFAFGKVCKTLTIEDIIES